MKNVIFQIVTQTSNFVMASNFVQILEQKGQPMSYGRQCLVLCLWDTWDTCFIPTLCVGSIIGGDTIRQLQVQCGAHIELHRGTHPNPNEKLFNIRGMDTDNS